MDLGLGLYLLSVVIRVNFLNCPHIYLAYFLQVRSRTEWDVEMWCAISDDLGRPALTRNATRLCRRSVCHCCHILLKTRWPHISMTEDEMVREGGSSDESAGAWSRGVSGNGGQWVTSCCRVLCRRLMLTDRAHCTTVVHVQLTHTRNIQTSDFIWPKNSSKKNKDSSSYRQSNTASRRSWVEQEAIRSSRRRCQH